MIGHMEIHVVNLLRACTVTYKLADCEDPANDRLPK